MFALVAVVLVAAPLPGRHPWAHFKPGAWSQYVMGGAEFRRGAVTLKKVGGGKHTLESTGAMEKTNGTSDLGVENASSSAAAKLLRKEKVQALGKEFDCDVYEWKSDTETNTEWVAAGLEWPVKERYVAPGRDSQWTLAALDVPMFVGGKKLKAARFEGTNPQGKMRMWRTHEVPGAVVAFETLDEKNQLTSFKILEAFGTSGKPPGAEVAKYHWHPWASHPVGAWRKGTDGEVKLGAKTATHVTLNKNTVALGQDAAAADPSSKFVGGAAVTIGGEELPCVLYTFLGKELLGTTEFKRTDCVSPFARVPLMSEVKGNVAGTDYLDLYTSLTLEEPMELAGKTIGAQKFRLGQKLGNGGGHERREIYSADVPGGRVKLEHVDPRPYDKVSQLQDFGAK